MTTLTTTAELTAAEPKRTAMPRTAEPTTCPSCGHRSTSAATTVRCEPCGLVAPRKAFQDEAAAAETWGAPRAYTIRGNVD